MKTPGQRRLSIDCRLQNARLRHAPQLPPSQLTDDGLLLRHGENQRFAQLPALLNRLADFSQSRFSTLLESFERRRILRTVRQRRWFACIHTAILTGPTGLRLFLPRLSKLRRLHEREKHDLLPGARANIVMHAQHGHAGDLCYQRFQDRPRRLD